MNTKATLAITLLLTACAHTPPSTTTDADPYMWLEDVDGTKAIEFVKQLNTRSQPLEQDPRFTQFKSESEKIMMAKDRIPYISYRNNFAYNFWQDEKHVRGLWRRTTLAEYKKAQPKWDILIDFDKLAKDENENWVYKGADCRAPEYNRCLISLSRGGKDAKVVREFDIKSKTFVADGFTVPEAKSRLSWADADTILIATDWGPGSLTKSGYPRIVKKWKRGSPLEKAETVFEIEPDDVSAGAYTVTRPEDKQTFIYRYIDQLNVVYWHLGADDKRTEIPFPRSANFEGYFHGQLLALLRDEWIVNKQTFKQGSLVSLPLASVLKNEGLKGLQLVFEPTEKMSLQGAWAVKDAVYISVLENVQSQIYQSTLNKNQWKSKKLELFENGSISIASANVYESDFFIEYEDFITPSRLFYFSPKTNRKDLLKTLPSRFKASDLVVKQNFSTSKDGTKIPYFLIHKKNIKLDGKNPTLLYGYGGFEIAQEPNYASVTGKLWLERGGVYVVSNIRGGSEFGPKWHKAALKEKRQNAYDDFLSIAEDLIQQKITSPEHLGIIGGSNGGLLVSVAFTQRPDLFKAVVSAVPLTDMLRYHKLLAGASWMGEYGNPEDPKMRDVLKKYSPYHNLKKDAHYPEVFFVTSTKDDRVHPAHARKIAARMQELGHPFYYYENIEGGHSAAANLIQAAHRTSLQYVYLAKKLNLQ